MITCHQGNFRGQTTTVRGQHARGVNYEKKSFHFLFRSIILLLAFCLFTPKAPVFAQQDYAATLDVLQYLYSVELNTHKTYITYAKKARSENFTGIAILFEALAAAEAIHAGNVERVMVDLMVKPSEEQIVGQVESTKKNLKKAINTELYHIEKVYPQSLDSIKAEQHETAIRYINYAWESEMMHRDLLKEMEPATGFFFKMLAKKIEQEAGVFYVCSNCGAALNKMPDVECPICQQPAAQYFQVGGKKQ